MCSWYSNPLVTAIGSVFCKVKPLIISEFYLHQSWYQLCCW